MCQAYDAEWRMMTAMENASRHRKIKWEGHAACLKGIPRHLNPQVPVWMVKMYGMPEATARCLKETSSWDRENMLAWWDGWDNASTERWNSQEPAGDIPVKRK